MPEGPEIHLASRFINSICKDKLFSGKVRKSEISKCPPIEWDAELYNITATSRGKELKLTLNAVEEDTSSKGSLNILFRFGLTGKFLLDKVKDIHKHAHLNFFTKDKCMVLSFVDQMRFGSWDVNGDWGKDRGPCVLLEYNEFRSNVLNNLDAKVFEKPICEVLMNQKYFNGIGNYLRAEVIYRAGVRPFEEARAVLKPIKDGAASPDILELCQQLFSEVVNLCSSNKSGYDADITDDEHSTFSAWLQCYYNPTMQNMTDHNKRTIWFTGEPGPLAPKEVKHKHKRTAENKVPKKSAVENTEHKYSKMPKTKEISEKSSEQGEKTRKQQYGVIKDPTNNDIGGNAVASRTRSREILK